MAGQRPGLGRKISDDNALGGTTRNIKNISNFVKISAYFLMHSGQKRPLTCFIACLKSKEFQHPSSLSTNTSNLKGIGNSSLTAIVPREARQETKSCRKENAYDLKTDP